MKVKDKKITIIIALIASLAVLAPAAWVLVIKMEGTLPRVTLAPAAPIIGAAQTLKVTAADGESGLRRLWVGIVKDGKETVLFERDFPAERFLGGGAVRDTAIELKIEPSKLGLSDGTATLRLLARDFSWRNWWHGNRTYMEIEASIDTHPPEITVLSRAHYINMGGAGLVIYKLSEACTEHGVFVGEHFFPGYLGQFADKQIGMALFAVAPDQGRDTRVAIQATDAAGNRTTAGFSHRIRKKVFRQDTLRISDRFLNWKMPEFQNEVQAAADSSMVDIFLRVNGQLRRDNYAFVRKITSQSEPKMLWEGTFSRLPNAANRARFADQREYIYNDRTIDHQVHMGIDLASVAHSPVPAANSGRVVFTGPIGIYGKTVLIDHGLGLFSMYSHLSAIDVEPGQTVAKDEYVGRTGKTGLAGGDHLHFAVMVHGFYVNPVEWWDDHWIKNNITDKIADAEP